MLKPFGYLYYFSARGFLDRFYYRVFGLPFMSFHLIYGLIIRHTVFGQKVRVLDYGTGDGVFLNQLSAIFATTGVGIDRLPQRIKLADKINQAFKLGNRFICSEFSEAQLKEKFDKILCLDVLEHVKNIETEVVALSGYLKIGGELIIQTPRDQDKKFILKKEHFYYGNDQHLHSGFTYDELEAVLLRHGFVIRYWQPNFGFFSQVIYEALEVIRRRSEQFYKLLWPIVYPLCLADILYCRPSRSNGLFIIAIKQ